MMPELSPNTKAILLLTAPLIAEAASPRPTRCRPVSTSGWPDICGNCNGNPPIWS